ncbi:tagaturonate epimerase family protein [Thermofilum pendens]|uniref:tagaturonate epimerase family protein n=1 Tax=Thermofilum pendens TaxID=2269 RepID=UPI00069B2DF6|nr:tagaturonate epimerase family protein [Thermofilum pendens]
MYLGKIPRPGFGIRIPEVVAPPLLSAFKSLGMTGSLMLSFNRETAPAEYIESSDPRLFYFGHTGTSIGGFIRSVKEYSKALSVPVEVEADHVSILGSVERALKKIAGVPVEEPLSEEEVSWSIGYVERELREAAEAGGVDFVTIDTCELIDYSYDKVGAEEVAAAYEEVFDGDERRALEERYEGVHYFLGGDRVVAVRLSREDVARLAVKYRRSLDYAERIYRAAREAMGVELGFEVAFDETPGVSEAREVFFYLSELLRRGLRVDFIAPNVGFRKREDYSGDLHALYERLRNLHAVVSSMNAYLSIHSGSGSHPYSDKGFGVWGVVGRATGGAVKYKMSGVLVQLLLEVMASYPPGSETRRLYEEIYSEVVEHLRWVVKAKASLYSPELETLLKRYEAAQDRFDPRADVFRHYFYVFQALRDEGGARRLRERLVEHYRENPGLRERYEKELRGLVERLASQLGYAGNAYRYRVVYA